MSEAQLPDPEKGSDGKHLTAAALDLDVESLPADDGEATERFKRWRHEDPFPEIAPALLNSADLFDYIAATGMIHPFTIDMLEVDGSLKPASCGIRIGGLSAHWAYQDREPDPQGPLLQKKILGEHDVLTLPPNSIVYATLAPLFRMPDYIAARFNLSIRYVYQGLLVGTGPLVDPGYAGPLQIPLHNLTSNTCMIPTSDTVLWMEFTKLSPHEKWAGTTEKPPRSGRYVPFPDRKQRGGLEEYLDHANNKEPIVSSIPAAVEAASRRADEASLAAAEASNAASKAAEETSEAQKRTALINFATLIAAVVGAITLFGFMYDIGHSTSSDVDTALSRSNELERELIQVRRQLHRQAQAAQPDSRR